jgi:hypothetical protein
MPDGSLTVDQEMVNGTVTWAASAGVRGDGAVGAAAAIDAPARSATLRTVAMVILKLAFIMPFKSGVVSVASLVGRDGDKDGVRA